MVYVLTFINMENTIVVIFVLALSFQVNGHSVDCSRHATSCELYLEVSHWYPMRLGTSKVYISKESGKIYKYLDASNESVSAHDVILADGSEHERVLTVFNKTMPGPTLIVYENQDVIVHLKNNLPSDGITIHWHGIEQRGTPWMDGAAFITQCPILPGQTFTYKFNSGKSGTFFYHSHTGLQTSMGMLAPFIVKKREQSQIGEHIMMIQDYHNRFTDDDVHVTGQLGVYYPGGVPMGFSPKIDGTITTVLDKTSVLINGRGRVYSGSQQLTNTPLTVFNVKSGDQYLFRVINGGTILQQQVSVDGHKLIIIALDGNNVEPYETDSVILHSGERVDFTIEANQATSNYWVRVESLEILHNNSAYAILRYDTAVLEEPVSVMKTCTKTMPCIVINCPMETYPGWSCIPVTELRSPVNVNAQIPNSSIGPFKELFINFGYFVLNGQITLHANGIHNKLPTVSALNQPAEVTPQCDEESECGIEKTCVCNNTISVDFGDVVQLNLINNGFLAIVHHPIHVHGYSFHVLKIGYGQTNESFARLGDNTDINCNTQDRANAVCNNASWSNTSWSGGNIPGADLDRAVRKDTVTIPAGGYAVIRFVADNPGLWFIHCHLDFHATTGGMAFLLNDSFPHVATPPPGFPECRSFPPPKWTYEVPDQPNTQVEQNRTCSENCLGIDERSFTPEEFWGTFGTLLFVIVLQFVISMVCLAKNADQVIGNHPKTFST